MATVDDPSIPGLLPAPPRPLTPRARKRSWNELNVRIWVIVTFAVLGASAYVTATRIHQALDDRWLIQNGIPINAKVLMGNGSPTPKRILRSEPIPARIQITLPEKDPVELEVLIDAKANSYLMVQGELPLKVDPNNPARWTEQETPNPWSTELVVPAMLVPLIVVIAIITLLKRRSVLNVWKDGALIEGVVVEARHTAAAPGSRLIRYSLADGSDPRIFGLLLPTSAGIPEPGQRLWLITTARDPKGAIAAGMYVESSTQTSTT